MFEPIEFHAKSSNKRKILNSSIIIVCIFFLWTSPVIALVKIIFNLAVLAYLIWLFYSEKKVTHIRWNSIDEIEIIQKQSSQLFKLSDCITTSWYCVWVLTGQNRGYKKLHIWFDQLDEQTAWQVRRNIEAWKEKSA